MSKEAMFTINIFKCNGFMRYHWSLGVSVICVSINTGGYTRTYWGAERAGRKAYKKYITPKKTKSWQIEVGKWGK